jgi:hypothetical protein
MRVIQPLLNRLRRVGRPHGAFVERSRRGQLAVTRPRKTNAMLNAAQNTNAVFFAQ